MDVFCAGLVAFDATTVKLVGDKVAVGVPEITPVVLLIVIPTVDNVDAPDKKA
jgi:hypothetical protein